MGKMQELIESPLSREELAVRYRDMCEDVRFSNLPGKIELDLWGRMVMSPASTYHGMVQGRLCQRLAVLGGEAFVEAPIVTAMGLFVADVAWGSAQFIGAHGGETPLMWAPELCIEVVSPSNSVKELQEKLTAYLAAGAEEVWILYPQTKRCEFHGRQGGLIERSRYPVDLTGIFDQPTSG
jgi:Uma2 family endonuclease